MVLKKTLKKDQRENLRINWQIFGNRDFGIWRVGFFRDF